MTKTPKRKIARFLSILLFSIILQLPVQAAEANREEGVPAEAPLVDYAGSKACSVCHQDIYNNWKQRVMSSFVRHRKDIEGPIPVDWKNSPIQEDEVFIVVGKRRKMAFVDKNWLVLPYEFKLRKGKWEKRGSWEKHSYDYRERCASCHAVALDSDTLHFKELNVGCEACHGPGRKHSEIPTSKIFVPGKNSNLRDTCRKCHNSRKNHARELEKFTGSFHK